MDSIRDEHIEEFIKLFSEAENVFLNNCCYWMAHILITRFGGEIVYDPVGGHFLSRINNKLWDIRGDVTSGYELVLTWETLRKQESAWAARIERDCIKKVGGYDE